MSRIQRYSAVSLLLLAACASPSTPSSDATGFDGGTPAVVGPPAHITITGPATLAVSSCAAITAVVTDAQGQVVTNPVLTWASTETRAATVNASGTVCGVADGFVAIVASIGTLQSNALGMDIGQPVRQVAIKFDGATQTITSLALPLLSNCTAFLVAQVYDQFGAHTVRPATWSVGTSGAVFGGISGGQISLCSYHVGTALVTATVNGITSSPGLNVTVSNNSTTSISGPNSVSTATATTWTAGFTPTSYATAVTYRWELSTASGIHNTSISTTSTLTLTPSGSWGLFVITLHVSYNGFEIGTASRGINNMIPGGCRFGC